MTSQRYTPLNAPRAVDLSTAPAVMLVTDRQTDCSTHTVDLSTALAVMLVTDRQTLR